MAKVCWAAKLGVVAPGAVVFSSTDTVSSVEFATIRSGLPSPLTSAAVTECGSLPVAKVCWAAKQGVVAPGRRRVQQHRHRAAAAIRDDQVGLAVAVDVGRRHRAPDRCRWRKSAGRRRRGWWRPGAVVFSSTDTVLSFEFATIRSGLPSPLTSAAVTEDGSLPVAKVCWVAKQGVVAPGAVVFSSTDTVLPSEFATIRSGLPSPLRSAAVTEIGLAAGGEGLLGGEAGCGGARGGGVQQHRHRVVARSSRRSGRACRRR